MNERERQRETELTNSHEGSAVREGGRGGGEEQGKKEQRDWKLKFMTLKMTMTETEPGPSLLCPLW